MPGPDRHHADGPFTAPLSADVEAMVQQRTAALALSEARLVQAQELAQAGSWEWDVLSGAVTWSDELFRIFGFAPGGCTPSYEHYLACVHPDYRPLTEAWIANVLDQKIPARLENRFIRPDGEVHIMDGRVDVVLDDSGRVIRVFGTAQDITERKQQEDSAQLFRTLLDHSTDSILITNPATARIVDCSGSACASLGYTREELLTLRVPDIETMIGSIEEFERQRQIVKTAGTMRFEGRQRRKDGSTFPVEVSVCCVARPEGDYVLTIARDITEHQRVELLLQRTVSSLKEAERIAHVGSWEFNAATNETVLSDELCRIYGFDPALPAPPLAEQEALFTPESREALRAAMAQALSTGRPYEIELERRMRDGSQGWLWARGEVITNSEGVTVGLRGVAQDITERRRAEAAIRLQSAALEAAANPIVITDRSGTIQWINAAFTTCTGYGAGEAIGRNTRELVNSGAHDRAFFAKLWDTVLAGNVWHGELTNRRKDGSLYPEEQTITPVKDDHGKVTHFIAIKRDLTEERQLRAQFLQAQKMESVGQLAAGIAHDFNNLLTVINGTADLASTALREGDPLRNDLEDIHRAGERAAALTRQLLAFSRKQIMKTDVLNLSTLVAALQSMLQRLVGEDIDLVVVPAKELGSVLADPGQIEQVILNLSVNARHAMPAGGTLTITTRDVELDEAFAARHPSVAPGPHVMLAVSDTGVGMNEATRMRIFEPFFTTKGPGKGTGLGLSTVYGIVKQSGGSIWVDSELGRGTTFTIYLPRLEQVAQPRQPTRSAMPVHGTETILIVDDEEVLRRVARRIFESVGYTVLTAANGREALPLLERHGGPVHLMFTDVVMPGMNGRDLAARLVDTRPQMKVLYTSGYAADATQERGGLNAAIHFIAKPYEIAELTRKVREVLDS
jgi:PAS domain S-box-containing protein